MLNLKLAVSELSITAAIWGLQFLKNSVLAKLVKAEYTNKSFKGNIIQTTVHVSYSHIFHLTDTAQT